MLTEKQFDALEKAYNAKPFTTVLTRHIGDALADKGLAVWTPRLPFQAPGRHYGITLKGIKHIESFDDEVTA